VWGILQLNVLISTQLSHVWYSLTVAPNNKSLTEVWLVSSNKVLKQHTSANELYLA
jgi:hypothetical protein